MAGGKIAIRRNFKSRQTNIGWRMEMTKLSPHFFSLFRYHDISDSPGTSSITLLKTQIEASGLLHST
jgi:hypothetical protein